MGTTAEKLAYLKETKNQIKQALETPSNVMRDYANWIKKYVDNQPTNTITDGVCKNALDVPLVSLGVDGNSYQGENPSPDNPQDIEVIDGVNLFDENKLKQGTWNNKYALQRVTIWATKIDIGESYTIINYDTSKYNFSCGVSSSNGYNESATASDDSGWLTSSTYTITASTTGYLFIQIKTPTGKDIKPSDLLSSDFQIIKGTITKPYLPYGCIGLEHTNEDGSKSEIIPINLSGNRLVKVGDVKDILKIYRNGNVEIGELSNDFIIDKDSNILVENDSSNNMFVFVLENINNSKGALSITLSNYIKHWNNTWDNNGQFISWNNHFYLRFKNNEFGFNANMTNDEALTHFKEMLAKVPLHCYYTILEPQTIKLPSISPIELWEGTNKFELITNLDTTFEMEYVVNKDYIMNTLETQNLLNIVEGENI